MERPPGSSREAANSEPDGSVVGNEKQQGFSPKQPSELKSVDFEGSPKREDKIPQFRVKQDFDRNGNGTAWQTSGVHLEDDTNGNGAEEFAVAVDTMLADHAEQVLTKIEAALSNEFANLRELMAEQLQRELAKGQAMSDSSPKLGEPKLEFMNTEEQAFENLEHAISCIDAPIGSKATRGAPADGKGLKSGASAVFGAAGKEGKEGKAGGLSDEQVIVRKSMDKETKGMLCNIVEHAKHGKATRQAEVIDQRSWWERRREALAEGTLSLGILANTVLLGVSADYGTSWNGWLMVDWFFAIFFLVAMLIKMHAVGLHKYLRGDEKYWNWFEVVVVVLGLLEMLVLGLSTGPDAVNLNVVRLLRMSRIGRLANVARLQWVSDFSDLSMMINGAIGGMKTLIWAMLLISLPIYAMAVMLRESMGDDGSEASANFKSVSIAFFTVFRCLVAGDCTDEQGRPIFAMVTSSHGWFLAVVYCLVTMLMTFGFYNVIMAIYIENILAAAKFNGHRQKRQRLLDATYFADKVTKLVEFVWKLHDSWQYKEGLEQDETCALEEMDMDEVASIEITPAFFDLLRSFKDFHDILCDLDIADEDQLDLFDTLDVDGGGTIDLEELVVGICKLRGDARRSDIVGVSLVARSTQKSLASFSEHVVEVLQKSTDTLNQMHRAVKEVRSDMTKAVETIQQLAARPSRLSRLPTLTTLTETRAALSALSGSHRTSTEASPSYTGGDGSPKAANGDTSPKAANGDRSPKAAKQSDSKSREEPQS